MICDFSEVVLFEVGVWQWPMKKYYLNLDTQIIVELYNDWVW